MLDTNKTLEYLAYLGYTFNNSHEDNQLSAINVTRDKKIDIARKQTARVLLKMSTSALAVTTFFMKLTELLVALD